MKPQVYTTRCNVALTRSFVQVGTMTEIRLVAAPCIRRIREILAAISALGIAVLVRVRPQLTVPTGIRLSQVDRGAVHQPSLEHGGIHAGSFQVTLRPHYLQGHAPSHRRLSACYIPTRRKRATPPDLQLGLFSRPMPSRSVGTKGPREKAWIAERVPAYLLLWLLVLQPTGWRATRFANVLSPPYQVGYT